MRQLVGTLAIRFGYSRQPAVNFTRRTYGGVVPEG